VCHWRHAALWHSLAITFGTISCHLVVTSVLSALLDLMFVAVQCYNRPLIVRLAERQNRKSKQGEI